jgi:hypothetical protein
MIRKSYPWLMLLAGVLIGLAASGRMVLRAQNQPRGERPHPRQPVLDGVIDDTRRPAIPLSGDLKPDDGPTERSATGNSSSPTSTLQELLARPYHFPFADPTPIGRVCVRLKETLKVPVVLDLAALARQDVTPEDTVQLDLDGVRLKTGLKLLVDQLGLTYQVVAEDNLLVITDKEGSDDPIDRIWTELRALHRDLHDVQDAVDDLTDALLSENGEGPRVRKPTIIEEMPAAEPVEGPREKVQEPAKKPDGAQRPSPGPRTTPPRVPLGGARRAL